MLCPDGICREKCEEIDVKNCDYGCLYNNKCLPIGIRVKGMYCNIDGVINSQLAADETCENNFECKTNLCIDGKCISSSLIKKVLNWLGRLFALPGKEKSKEVAQILDCGASSECIENAFKECKPAKITQGGMVSEIVGLEGEKCVVKITAGNESVECKFENYALGTKNLGSNIEKYCSGTLIYRLTTTTKTATPEIRRTEEA